MDDLHYFVLLLEWLLEPSIPPVAFFISLFVWYFAGFTSDLVVSCMIRREEKKC